MKKRMHVELDAYGALIIDLQGAQALYARLLLQAWWRKLPEWIEASLREGKHCMLSPLADRSCLLVLAHLRRCQDEFEYESQPLFDVKAFFWVAISQLFVHDGAVLSAMMRNELAMMRGDAARSIPDTHGSRCFQCFQEQASVWFDHAMSDLGLKSSMTSGLSQPVMHLLDGIRPQSDMRTHRSMVQNFIRRFDFFACAGKLVHVGRHDERKQILTNYVGKVTLRIISIFSCLGRNPRPHQPNIEMLAV